MSPMDDRGQRRARAPRALRMGRDKRAEYQRAFVSSCSRGRRVREVYRGRAVVPNRSKNNQTIVMLLWFEVSFDRACFLFAGRRRRRRHAGGGVLAASPALALALARAFPPSAHTEGPLSLPATAPLEKSQLSVINIRTVLTPDRLSHPRGSPRAGARKDGPGLPPLLLLPPTKTNKDSLLSATRPRAKSAPRARGRAPSRRNQGSWQQSKFLPEQLPARKGRAKRGARRGMRIFFLVTAGRALDAKNEKRQKKPQSS